MRKVTLTLLCTILGLANIFAQGFPIISNDSDTKWYLIQFTNGGNALTAETDKAQITTSAAIGKDAQLWKITGDNTNGYTFTNKKGYTLYVGSAAKNQMVHASGTPSGVSQFFINATTHSNGGYEIQPKGNTAISMNLWGGPAENRGVGLWDKDDQNNPVQFVDANTFENIGKISIIPYPAELTAGEGSLPVETLKAITYPNDDVQAYVAEFATMLAATSGITLEMKESGAEAAEGEIWLIIDETLPIEGYTLKVKENGIEIKAATKAGFLYAMQTLKQLLPRSLFANKIDNAAEWNIPFVEIADQPQYEHRGFMMDVARHFFDKDEVKKVLDIMADHIVDRNNVHLILDSFRLESDRRKAANKLGIREKRK